MSQSVPEIEAMCERSMLAQAEAYMSAQDEDPTAEECFASCRHADACRRVFVELCHMSADEDGIYDALGCAEECQEYEEA